MKVKHIFFSGGNEDDEPDKMAIAFGRFGTFKRFIIRSIANFFVFLKNKIIEMVVFTI